MAEWGWGTEGSLGRTAALFWDLLLIDLKQSDLCHNLPIKDSLERVDAHVFGKISIHNCKFWKHKVLEDWGGDAKYRAPGLLGSGYKCFRVGT